MASACADANAQLVAARNEAATSKAALEHKIAELNGALEVTRADMAQMAARSAAAEAEVNVLRDTSEAADARRNDARQAALALGEAAAEMQALVSSRRAGAARRSQYPVSTTKTE